MSDQRVVLRVEVHATSTNASEGVVWGFCELHEYLTRNNCDLKVE
jgi:hypothetical protein